jgi:hypothetical protein
VIWRPILAALGLAALSRAAENAYVNSSFDLPAGARLPGMGDVSLGMPGDASFLLQDPAALAELTRPEGFYHHGSLYEGLDISQDEAFGAMPLGKGTVLGFGAQRIAAGGILQVADGETPDFDSPNTFDAADYTLATAVARSLYDGQLLVGGVMRLSVRQMDQLGLGAQLDGSVVWKPMDGWRLGARVERAIATATVWESGYREYSPMDVAVGLGYEGEVPYLYGRGSLGIETPGLFSDQASNTFSTSDARLTDDPYLFLRSCRLGGEFRFDWGGVIRAGVEIQALTRWSDIFQGQDQTGLYGESWGQMAFGVGYLWGERLRIDYSMQSTPDLGLSHRISLGWMFGTAPKPHTDEDLPVPRHAPVASPVAHPDDSLSDFDAPETEQHKASPAGAGSPAAAPKATEPAPDAAPVPKPTMPAASPSSDDEPVEQLQK